MSSVVLSYENRSPYAIRGAFFGAQVKKMITHLNKVYQRKLFRVNLSLLTPKQIQHLHQTFCSKDTPTDILTFPDQTSLPPYKTNGGDIALCPEVLFKEDNNPSPIHRARQLYTLVLHGLLHLYGLQHNYRPTTLDNVGALQRNLLDLLAPNPDLFEKKE